MSSIVINSAETPWLKFYGDVPATLTYPGGSMFDCVERTAFKYRGYTAYEFMGTVSTFEQLIRDIEACARSLRAIGINAGDKVTIALPNCPQAVIIFYAINYMGAIANMVHPLSSENEIAFYLTDSESVAAITLDQFYPKFAAIRERTQLPKLIITSIKDALKPIMRLGYSLTAGREIEKLPEDADIITWEELMKAGAGFSGECKVKREGSDPAAILYSGGTTGTTKGILLSNLNFNALAKQIDAMSNCMAAGNSMLAVLPMFHGFGLGVCVHSALVGGCKAILMPRLVLKEFAKVLKKKKPNYVAGVPTLFEALLRLKDINGVDLSYLKGVFSGGDSLSIELKKKIDAFLKEHGAKVTVREGYGTTECVTASCLTPYNTAREGSIGLPMPDMLYKIVKTGTTETAPFGEEGEICLTGPTLMMEYVKHPEETANTLKTHGDGRTWLHTGDLGTMDEDGFVYFRQRIKRMIVSNGYNIYPSQLENVIDSHSAVLMSCCIGVPDPYKMQKVKAFVMLKEGESANEQTKQSILEHCKKGIAKYAMPYDIEFRTELPKTLVGKVAYRVLEEEEAANR